VHGNGPQVGNLIIQQEAGSGQIPPYSLDIWRRHDQGSMGYMLERMLINRLRFLKIKAPVTSVLTEVVVDKEDRGFREPTKSPWALSTLNSGPSSSCGPSAGR